MDEWLNARGSIIFTNGMHYHGPDTLDAKHGLAHQSTAYTVLFLGTLRFVGL